MVPTSFFDRSFARFNLYFYDQTGRTLLPDPVFIPRGEQTATNLVRGLLTGAGRGLAQVTRSALPSRTDLDLSVVVTESGVAEVPLSREILQVSVERARSRSRPARVDAAPGPGHHPGADHGRRCARTPARRPDRRPGDLGRGVRRRGQRHGAALGPARRPGGRRVLGRARARGQPTRQARVLHAKPRRERVAAPDRRGLRQRQDRVRRLRGRRVDGGVASRRGRHRRAAPAVRHVRRPLAGGPYAERGARARRRRRGDADSCGFPA